MKKTWTSNKSPQLQEFYDKNRFLDLLIKTRKYRDLIWSKEAFFCAVISIVITSIAVCIIDNNEPIGKVHQIIPIAQSLLTLIIGGFFSLLGFIIGGLALITGTISERVIREVDKEGNIEELISVIFNFYFSGMVTGLTLVFTIMNYLITFIQLPFNFPVFLVATFILVYMIVFSIVYAVMLLGTCIRILLLRYHVLTYKNKDD